VETRRRLFWLTDHRIGGANFKGGLQMQLSSYESYLEFCKKVGVKPLTKVCLAILRENPAPPTPPPLIFVYKNRPQPTRA